jgi:PKD repeat protein
VNTTNYYVESQIFPPTGFNTPHDNLFGGGNYYAGGTYRALVFDCAAPVTLVSVKCTVILPKAKPLHSGKMAYTINTMTVNVPTGSSRVTLNWPLPVGTDLELGSPDGADLFRNNSGATPPYNYGPVSITGTTAGAAGYYYFFYDWEVQDLPCISARIPVTATMTPGPTSAFTQNIFANLVDFIDNSTGNPVTFIWDFGDGNTSPLQNPSHAYANTGQYTVCLTTVNAAGCSNQTCHTINILSVGIEESSYLQ